MFKKDTTDQTFIGAAVVAAAAAFLSFACKIACSVLEYCVRNTVRACVPHLLSLFGTLEFSLRNLYLYIYIYILLYTSLFGWFFVSIFLFHFAVAASDAIVLAAN